MVSLCLGVAIRLPVDWVSFMKLKYLSHAKAQSNINKHALTIFNSYLYLTELLHLNMMSILLMLVILKCILVKSMHVIACYCIVTLLYRHKDKEIYSI